MGSSREYFVTTGLGIWLTKKEILKSSHGLRQVFPDRYIAAFQDWVRGVSRASSFSSSIMGGPACLIYWLVSSGFMMTDTPRVTKLFSLEINVKYVKSRRYSFSSLWWYTIIRFYNISWGFQLALSLWYIIIVYWGPTRQILIDTGVAQLDWSNVSINGFSI